MKKMMTILLVAAMLLLTACGAQQTDVTPSETTPAATEAATEAVTEAPTEAPTEPVPECDRALVQVDKAPAILMLLSRGDSVDVVGEYDKDHYIVKTESGYGLIEKQLLRMSGEADYEAWTGFARSKAPIYDNFYLTGEPLQTLKVNAKVEILDELNNCYVVTCEGEAGFMAKDQVSKSQITGGGGGSADGGDISLGFGGIVKLSTIEQSGEVTGTAKILADGTRVVLGYFDLDSLAPVVTEEGFAPAWEGYYTLYMNGLYAYLPQELARMEGEAAYESWTGFAARNSVVFDNYLLQGEGTSVKLNTEVSVLWDGGNFYVISIDGAIGYMPKANVGESRFATGGGGGGGGDWTPPAM